MLSENLDLLEAQMGKEIEGVIVHKETWVITEVGITVIEEGDTPREDSPRQVPKPSKR